MILKGKKKKRCYPCFQASEDSCLAWEGNSGGKEGGGEVGRMEGQI